MTLSEDVAQDTVLNKTLINLGVNADLLRRIVANGVQHEGRFRGLRNDGTLILATSSALPNPASLSTLAANVGLTYKASPTAVSEDAVDGVIIVVISDRSPVTGARLNAPAAHLLKLDMDGGEITSVQYICADESFPVKLTESAYKDETIFDAVPYSVSGNDVYFDLVPGSLY